MTVKELCENCGFKSVSLPEPDRQVNGAYIGDLLSWVMGRANAGNAWVTIMSNINVIAVASLSDVSCVVLAEGVTLADDIIETAIQKGVNVMSSEFPIFETAEKLSGLI